jgi:hypothetical protein
MPNFAILENGVAVNIVIAEPEYAATQGWVAAPDNMSAGCVFDGTSWSNPNAPTPEQAREKLAAEMREQRNARLSATDWTQAVDVPQATKDKWAPYRQALRDVPQQAGFPDNIQWPSKPE